MLASRRACTEQRILDTCGGLGVRILSGEVDRIAPARGKDLSDKVDQPDRQQGDPERNGDNSTTTRRFGSKAACRLRRTLVLAWRRPPVLATQFPRPRQPTLGEECEW